MLMKIRDKFVVGVCNARLNQFADMFEPTLRDDVLNHCYIAGGAIYSLYNLKRPKDYDIFCDTPELTNRILQYLGCDNVKDKILRYGHATYNGVTFSDNAATIGKFQFVYKFVGKWLDVLAEFDFKHNMYAVHCNKVVTLNNTTNRNYLSTKKLTFNTLRPRDISGVLLRIPKFVGRGFFITKKEHALILEKLNTSDPHEISLIEKYSKGLGY